MAATRRNRNSNVNKDVFPPTDRELALRGEIKTGWSTLALHQNIKNLELSQTEVSKIERVLKRAEAVERINQLRIGVELMKHQQKKDSSLGDGKRTCLICGIDFSSHGQYRRKPVAVNFCDKCSFAVCSSCMLGNERQSGEGVTLCPLCYEEKEIWKRSGAWFNNTLPVINISKEELEKFEEQQKLSQSRAFTLGKHTDETTAREFVNPYQLEADSEESEDEELNTFHLRKSTTPEPPAAAAASSSFPPPISFVDKPHLQPALQRPSAYKPAASSTFPQRTPSPSDALAEFRDRSGITGLEFSESVGQRLQPLGGDEESGGRAQRIVRRGAMSTLDKTRLDTSRKRALGTFGISDSPTSPTESEFVKTSPKIVVNGGDSEGERNPRQLPIPPQHPPPQLSPLDEEKSDQSGKVDIVVESPTAKPRKPVVKRRREKEGEERAGKPLEDEFKKVAVVPSTSTQQPALPPPSKKPPVLSSSATDEFHKVGVMSVAPTPPSTAASKPPPPSKPAPLHEVDEFRKVTPKSKPPPRVAGGSEEQEEFKTIDTRPESPTRKPVIPPRDEFRKVSPPKEVKKPSPPPVRAEMDEFRKVSATKKSPPPQPKTELDEFRKVGIVAVATTSPSNKPPTLPSKPANFYETRSSVERDVPPKRVSMSPPAAKSPPREEAGEAPPPLPEKPSHLRGEVKQESPRRLPDLPSVVPSEHQSEGDRKSITSTSSLTSQSSRKSPLTDSLPHEQSPSSAFITVTDEQEFCPLEEREGSSQPKNGSPIRRQGEIDEDQPSLFRKRSGALRAGSRGRSRSPGARQQHQTPDEVKPEAKNDDNIIDDFQPRARSRSGAVDSRTPPRRGISGGSIEKTSPPPPVPLQRGVKGGSVEKTSPPPPVPLQRGVKGGSVEKTPPPPPVPQRIGTDEGSIEETSPPPPPVPRIQTIHTAKPVVPPRQNSAGSRDETVTTTPPSDDVVHPRMRTRSRAYHGDARRPRLQQQHQQQLAGNRSIKEDSPTNDDDLSQPRMRSRSRVLRGNSQRPKMFTRTPSPSSVLAQSMGDVDGQSSLEVPNSEMRPRSSSTGRGMQRNTDFDHSSPDTPKPEGEQ